jgi:hypothetical protein
VKIKTILRDNIKMGLKEKNVDQSHVYYDIFQWLAPANV